MGDNQRLQADPEPVTFEEKEDRVKTAVPEMDAGEETTGGQVSAKELEEAGDELYYPSVAEEYPEKVLAEARKKKDEVKDELARRIAADKKADKLKVLAEVIDEVKLTREEKRALYKEISREITGYGVLEPYMEDPKVTELMINNHQSAFVKVDGIIRRIPLKFDSPKALYDYIQNLIQPIGRPLDETNTNLNGQLPDGTRLNATCPPQSRECTLNLRKPPGRTARFTVDDYVKSGAATREIMDFLGYYHNRRANMLILGATDTGKTTFIRIMIENYSSPRERWIMLEDTLELNCHHPHFLAFQQVQRGADESEWFTLAQIFDRTVLRKAPDRIGVGEILRNEATALVRGVSAGHDGFIGSMHAGSPHKTIFLLVTKLKEAGMDIDEEYLRRMLHECIDFMIFLKRSSRTGRRVIWQVWEVLSLDEAAELGVKPFNLLYKFNPRTGKFEKVNELASEEKKEKFGTPEEVVEW
ncbi:MAG: ATPase, T2SS/T4P/T4SS family [Bacillota bacterium]